MSVDFGVRVIYGFQLDENKLVDWIDKRKEEDSSFNEWEWFEELAESGNCEIVVENHYVNFIDETAVYFGIPVYNDLSLETFLELEKVRLHEVCDELIAAFGSYDAILNTDVDSIVPKVYPIGVAY